METRRECNSFHKMLKKNTNCTLKIVYSAKLLFNNKGKYNNLYKKQAHEGFTERSSLKELITDLVQEIGK